MAREDWQSRTTHHGEAMGHGAALVCQLHYDATPRRGAEAWLLRTCMETATRLIEARPCTRHRGEA
jgi:hypothetical protein